MALDTIDTQPREAVEGASEMHEVATLLAALQPPLDPPEITRARARRRLLRVAQRRRERGPYSGHPAA